MECKCNLLLECLRHILELIDTLWNVNYYGHHVTYHVIYELIDTLWNVNSFYRSNSANALPELIDTLWNVNRVPQQLRKKLLKN